MKKYGTTLLLVCSLGASQRTEASLNTGFLFGALASSGIIAVAFELQYQNRNTKDPRLARISRKDYAEYLFANDPNHSFLAKAPLLATGFLGALCAGPAVYWATNKKSANNASQDANLTKTSGKKISSEKSTKLRKKLELPETVRTGIQTITSTQTSTQNSTDTQANDHQTSTSVVRHANRAPVDDFALTPQAMAKKTSTTKRSAAARTTDDLAGDDSIITSETLASWKQERSESKKREDARTFKRSKKIFADGQTKQSTASLADLIAQQYAAIKKEERFYTQAQKAAAEQTYQTEPEHQIAFIAALRILTLFENTNELAIAHAKIGAMQATLAYNEAIKETTPKTFDVVLAEIIQTILADEDLQKSLSPQETPKDTHTTDSKKQSGITDI